MKIVGFEGVCEGDTPVTTAAAAFETKDQWLVNSITKHRVPLENKESLAKSGHLTLLKKPTDVPDDLLTKQCVMVLVQPNTELGSYFAVDLGKVGGLVTKGRHSELRYYLFGNKASFEKYRRNVCDRVVSIVLSSDDPTSFNDLVRWTAAFCPGNPTIQALRVHLSTRKDYLRGLAVKSIRPQDQEIFDEFLAALTNIDLVYTLKYQNGVATGGGFDVDDAFRTFKKINDLHCKLKPLMLSRFPFLTSQDLPPPRMRSLVAASAEVHLASDIEGKPLIERVARNLELRLIHRLLSGQDFSMFDDENLLDAAKEVCQPTQETQLQHALGKEKIEPVVLRSRRKSELAQGNPMTVFCFQSGIMKNGSRVELNLGADLTLTFTVTNLTEGSSYLDTETDFLRRPLTATFRRELNSDGGQKLFLLKLSPLRVGDWEYVTAIPSSILKHVFLTNVSIQLTRVNDDKIESDLGDICGLSARTKQQALQWAKDWTALCVEHELRLASAGNCFFSEAPMRHKKQASALERILVSLRFSGGKATIPSLINDINYRFNTDVRINNTRREVLRSDLIEFDPENDQVIRLKDRGSSWALAYVMYGGDQGRLPEKEDLK
jgi:hypothetical protein